MQRPLLDPAQAREAIGPACEERLVHAVGERIGAAAFKAPGCWEKRAWHLHHGSRTHAAREQPIGDEFGKRPGRVLHTRRGRGIAAPPGFACRDAYFSLCQFSEQEYDAYDPDKGKYQNHPSPVQSLQEEKQKKVSP